MRFSFTAEVWLHDGSGAWHFISVPEAIADDIEEMYGQQARGFGSIRVEVTVGSSTWSTSVFPDSKRRTYVLPLKKAVRLAERLTVGSSAEFELAVIQDSRTVSGSDRTSLPTKQNRPPIS